MKKIKCKEFCPICKCENTQVCWTENKDMFLYENEFYLCHRCGFFFRKYGNGNIVNGVTFDPKKIPLKPQIQAIRKHHTLMEGLLITDHFNYKPSSVR